MSDHECAETRRLMDLLAAVTDERDAYRFGVAAHGTEREVVEETLPPSNGNGWRGERRVITTTTHADGSTTVHTTAWQVTA